MTFFCDLGERSAVAVKGCLLTCVFLKATDDAIGVLRIDLHEACFASTSLTSDQGTAGTGEHVRNDVAGLAAVQQCTLDKFHRLGGRM